ncbi:helix-turn-helix domain-containing protein [Lactococcus lactis]|uniref:helix-turn-helix domain-containing protein n=1 Tax=Lactococcus lactis TaxID=1358 RepID=UPI0001C05331|nr:helix-turn-helix transcriptional regulator [Lactococcus lactis]ADA65192.1 Phage protein, regulator [Lactococcus lactis subsp. lactis KF147]
MEYLKQFRKQKKLTQDEMARILGFTKSHYVKIEMGLRNPGYKFLESLKKEFNEVDVNEFFK